MTTKKIAGGLKMLVSRPLIINAFVKKSGGTVRQVNWGDDINYHLLKYLTKREIVIYFDSPFAMALKMANYLCIGSTLNYLSTRETIVWGAGVLDPGLDMREEPAHVTAVRGPLSRDYLLSRGISCPEIYGDPALLLPYFYQPALSNPKLPDKTCVVPHYADQGSPILDAIRRNHPDLAFLNIAHYGKWTSFIDQIRGHSAVLSSSLHALIVAEAYGIPNYWISVSDNVIGRGFKFLDYFASIGKSITEPFVLDAASNPAELVAAHRWSAGRIDLKKLLAACPFEIKQPVRYEHPLDL